MWTNVWGFDHTGRKYSDLLAMAVPEENVAFWGQLCRTTNIALGRNTLSWLEGQHQLFKKEYLNLVLPLSDNGETPGKYLTVLSLET